MFLPDVNIWLALVFEAHIHHTIVKKWINLYKNADFFFCRVTQQGFLRLSTNPAVFKDEALTLKKAWEIYERILSDTKISFLSEPSGLEFTWREYTSSKNYTNKVWSDAYIAAFFLSEGLTLVTLDKGFSKFKKLDCIILDS